MGDRVWIRTIVRAGAAAGTGFLGLILAASFWLVISKVWLKTPVPSVLGYAPVYVLSGSMEPTFSAGDMIVIRPQKEYRPGDVVTFQSGGELVTHRIISESREGFTVKGDANNVSDEEKVPREDVRGKLVLVLPRLGTAAAFLRTRRGVLLLLAVVLLAAWQTFRERRSGDLEHTGDGQGGVK